MVDKPVFIGDDGELKARIAGQSTSNLTLLADSTSQILVIGGTELTNSRRYVNFTGCTLIRWQYTASTVLTGGVDYSVDNGTTWISFVNSTYTGTNPRITPWITIPTVAQIDNLLLRANAIGTGLLTTISFVMLSYR